MSTLRERTMQQMVERRERLLKGEINSIPTPFPRFEEDFIGIEQSTYYAITAATKGSKSQFASFLFIYHTLLYAYYKKKDIKITIFYFALEETPERVMQRFMSYLLYDFTKGEIRISPRDLRSSVNTKPVPQEVLDLLNSEEIVDVLNFFEENIKFDSSSNPTGIIKFCEDYAREHGEIHWKKYEKDGEEGLKFDYYIPDNPNEYKIVVIDTINLITTENKMDLKHSMDFLSEKLAKRLRNWYGFSPVVIIQQAFAGENIEAQKLNKPEPSVHNLGDSKYISRDANIVLGLFSPIKFKIPEYEGYNIRILKDNVRFLSVLVNRDGSPGGVLPLYFDGAVCLFKELPRIDDPNLNKVYNFIKNRDAAARKALEQKAKTNFLVFNKNSRKKFGKKKRKY